VLSRSSEYAIRALTHLARLDDGRHHLARDMAEQLGIPAPFLGKVLQPLVSAGLLHSQRGRSGGFRLAQPADKIQLVQIVQAEETLGAANTCLLGQRDCQDAAPCPMHEYWTKASTAFHERLTRTTLADLVRFSELHPGCIYPDQNERSGLVQSSLSAAVREAM
jgi:Rrf2 family transcriptional regulator, iron-sulfur cluster assembly transcription factor